MESLRPFLKRSCKLKENRNSRLFDHVVHACRESRIKQHRLKNTHAFAHLIHTLTATAVSSRRLAYKNAPRPQHKQESPMRSRRKLIRSLFTTLSAACCLLGPLQLYGQSALQQNKTPRLTIPKPEDLAVAGNGTPIPQKKRQNSEYVFASRPHPTIGDRYIIVTDHTDSDVLAAIQRL